MTMMMMIHMQCRYEGGRQKKKVGVKRRNEKIQTGKLYKRMLYHCSIQFVMPLWAVVVGIPVVYVTEYNKFMLG